MWNPQTAAFDPAGLVHPGSNLIDLVRRYRATPVAFENGGCV